MFLIIFFEAISYKIKEQRNRTVHCYVPLFCKIPLHFRIVHALAISKAKALSSAKTVPIWRSFNSEMIASKSVRQLFWQAMIAGTNTPFPRNPSTTQQEKADLGPQRES